MAPAFCSAEDLADHDRDLRKHEPRASDPINAIEIAVLVKGMKSITEAAKLIDQYAATVASEAKVDAVSQTYDLIDGVLARAGR
jgi:hypothetical protein